MLCNNTQIRPHRTSENQSYFTLGELLAAAKVGSHTRTTADDRCGVDLDGASLVVGSRHSARYDGAVMEVDIKYVVHPPMCEVMPPMYAIILILCMHGM